MLATRVCPWCGKGVQEKLRHRWSACPICGRWQYHKDYRVPPQDDPDSHAASIAQSEPLFSISGLVDVSDA